MNESVLVSETSVLVSEAMVV